MKYRVVWTPTAERELTALWLASRCQQLVTAAAHQADELLASDPKNVGESRDANKRIMFIPPLVVEFEVVDGEHTVFVRAVREQRSGPIA
jgi:mRNA-degrading endonuclease RelE of RelBE toxin-antitoxin system